MSMTTTSGRSVSGHLEGLVPVAGLADDVEVVLQVEDGAKAIPHHLMVVHQQYPDAHADSVFPSEPAELRWVR